MPQFSSFFISRVGWENFFFSESWRAKKGVTGELYFRKNPDSIVVLTLFTEWTVKPELGALRCASPLQTTCSRLGSTDPKNFYSIYPLFWILWFQLGSPNLNLGTNRGLFRRRWILDLSCEGSRNYLSALHLAIENDAEAQHNVGKPEPFDCWAPLLSSRFLSCAGIS